MVGSINRVCVRIDDMLRNTWGTVKASMNAYIVYTVYKSSRFWLMPGLD